MEKYDIKIFPRFKLSLIIISILICIGSVSSFIYHNINTFKIMVLKMYRFIVKYLIILTHHPGLEPGACSKHTLFLMLNFIPSILLGFLIVNNFTDLNRAKDRRMINLKLIAILIIVMVISCTIVYNTDIRQI